MGASSLAGTGLARDLAGKGKDGITAARGDIAGIGFSRGTREELYSILCAWLSAQTSAPRIVTYVNPHVFNLAQRNEHMRLILRTADMVAVDGIGFALAVRWLTGHPQTRTVMTPLFDRILATESMPHLRAVLIGGVPQVAEQGAAAVNRASRCIEIVAACSGYRPDQELMEFLTAHAKVDLVLVAMGSPRSEEFIASARDTFAPKIFWNIGGGTLHYYAGTLKRVPDRVSRLGLQWLWRIVHEPGIAPRYVAGIPQFLLRVIGFRIQQSKQQRKLYGRAYRKPGTEAINRKPG